MPGRSSKINEYYPSPVPHTRNPEAFLAFLKLEFLSIFNALQGIWNLPVRSKPPDHYQEGTIVYADGVSWDPGQGKGPYCYDGTTWRLLWAP